MEILLGFIGYTLLAAFLVVVFFALVIGLKLFIWFDFKPCKECKHTMEYKGLQEEDDREYYLFYCPKCGLWEKIPKEEFIRDCDKDCNPNN